MVNTLLIFEIFCHVLKGREGEREKEGEKKEMGEMEWGLKEYHINHSMLGQ